MGQEYFGLLMVVPPAATHATEVMPREIIFVVDTSGSMGGVSIEQARASVAQALQQLRPSWLAAGLLLDAVSALAKGGHVSPSTITSAP